MHKSQRKRLYRRSACSLMHTKHKKYVKNARPYQFKIRPSAAASLYTRRLWRLVRYGHDYMPPSGAPPPPLRLRSAPPLAGPPPNKYEYFMRGGPLVAGGRLVAAGAPAAPRYKQRKPRIACAIASAGGGAAVMGPTAPYNSPACASRFATPLHGGFIGKEGRAKAKQSKLRDYTRC